MLCSKVVRPCDGPELPVSLRFIPLPKRNLDVYSVVSYQVIMSFLNYTGNLTKIVVRRLSSSRSLRFVLFLLVRSSTCVG